MIATEKRYVGKEASELERVEAGLVEELEEVRQVLRVMRVEQIMAETGCSRRQAFYLHSGQRRPAKRSKRLLLDLVNAESDSCASGAT
ncbi:MAG: hypothetical protein M3Q03_11435 [Chloroflexota bacterium]|nr:hypothetical protein [Chloroflexota bacterium]